MFRFFKKKQMLDPMEDLLNLAIEDLGEKWISYTKSTRFKISVPLSESIDIFTQPLDQFFKNRYINPAIKYMTIMKHKLFWGV